MKSRNVQYCAKCGYEFSKCFDVRVVVNEVVLCTKCGAKASYGISALKK